jgi:hypothetical protein
MADPRSTPDPQTPKAGGARMEDDAHRCLYIGTPWAEEAIADHHDVDEFKEASRMIGWVLLCRGILHGLISSFVCSCCSHLLIGRRLG